MEPLEQSTKLRLAIPYYGYYVLWKETGGLDSIRDIIILLEHTLYIILGWMVGYYFVALNIPLITFFTPMTIIFGLVTLIEAMILKIKPEILSLGEIKKEDNLKFKECFILIGLNIYHLFFLFILGITLGGIHYVGIF